MIPAYLATNLFSVTPSDTVDLPGFGAIKCKGTAGDVVVRLQNPNGVYTVTYPIAVDETLLVDARRILSTGTTATGLWCLAY